MNVLTKNYSEQKSAKKWDYLDIMRQDLVLKNRFNFFA